MGSDIFRLRSRIALNAKGFEMFGTKSGLRLISSIVVIATAIVGPATAANALAPNPFSKTLNFLQGSFSGNRFIEGFTPGQADFGFTMEALLQRKALGDTTQSFKFAAAYSLQNPNLSGNFSTRNGFLFNSAGAVNYPLAGKFAFVSAVLKADNRDLRNSVLSSMVKNIKASGDLKGMTPTTFDRSWVMLGLAANGRTAAARQVATALIGGQLKDGSFNDGYTLEEGSTDGTGIALQALATVSNQGSNDFRSKVTAAKAKAVKWLQSTIQSGDHWESWGDYNINGTAYAVMGLKASGVAADKMIAWLKSKIATDGGFTTSWSNGAGDIYATAQAVVPALGKSYLDLLPR